MRVVVIGGLGNFGARICARLSSEPGFEIIATSRHANTISPNNGVRTATLDIDHPALSDHLKALAPNLVIHCAGPFQGQDYRVARATLGCGSHYVDLADGRQFVSRFAAAIDSAAQAAGYWAVTGASTLPALSSAVIDSMLKPDERAASIEICIAPGQQAPRGVATMQAVLGYAGQPIPWWQDGAWRVAHGWQDLKQENFSFGRRLSAACDVPDLVLMPARYPGVQTVAFRAALEVSVQHRALWILAALRRIGVPMPIRAPTLNRLGNWFDRFGSGTGGMKVKIGVDSHTREWELVAPHNHGPEIPCMAAVLLALKLRDGYTPRPGAYVCLSLISLQEFESEFSRWGITTDVQES